MHAKEESALFIFVCVNVVVYVYVNLLHHSPNPTVVVLLYIYFFFVTFLSHKARQAWLRAAAAKFAKKDAVDAAKFQFSIAVECGNCESRQDSVNLKSNINNFILS